LVGLLDVEQPADVRVPEALDEGLEVVAVAPRGVWVTLLVAERMVAAVVGNPADDGTLDREAAGDGERDPHRSRRLERAVGEVAVEPDSHAMPGDRVHDDGDQDVVPAEPP